MAILITMSSRVTVFILYIKTPYKLNIHLANGLSLVSKSKDGMVNNVSPNQTAPSVAV